MRSNTDLFNNINLKRAISPAAAVTDNTAFVSQIIDMQGNAACVFAILTGSLADADATFTALLEESAESDLSGSNAVADEDLLGTEALAGFAFGDDDKCFKLGYKGIKRYVRLTVTPANNTGNAFVAAVALLWPQLGAAANPPA